MKHLSNVLAVVTFLLLMVAIVVSNIALDPLWPGILYCLSIASALAWVALNTKLLLYFFSKKSTRSGVNLAFVVTLVFFILFYLFPAGLVLYWTATNLLAAGQQAIVARHARP